MEMKKKKKKKKKRRRNKTERCAYACVRGDSPKKARGRSKSSKEMKEDRTVCGRAGVRACERQTREKEEEERQQKEEEAEEEGREGRKKRRRRTLGQKTE